MLAQARFLDKRPGPWPSGLATSVLAFVLALPSTGLAQLVKPAGPASAPLPAETAAKPVASKPSWTELTPLQQQALKPLAASWHTISEAQKRKWLEVSKNYPALLPADQATLHSRMNEWVALSPRQRAEARLNFAKAKELSTELTAEEKKAKWQTYQALSPEEKQQLASKAAPRPAGAALAVKPVAPQKLAVVTPHGAKPDAKPAPNSTTSPATTTTPQTTEAVPAGLGAAPSN